jgi:hypothetical protein
MKTMKFKLVLSTIILFSLMMVAATVNAAPVKFNQVVQVINAKPGKAGNSNFAKLQIARNDSVIKNNDGDGDGDGDKDKKGKKEGDKKAAEETAEATHQDKRVITTTTIEIAEAEECNCEEAIVLEKGGFPKWALFGLGAAPLPFIKFGNSPTPTPTTTITPTPTTPMTPTPEPTPEPMTLLLFGTGLTGVGFAARRKLKGRKKGSSKV